MLKQAGSITSKEACVWFLSQLTKKSKQLPGFLVVLNEVYLLVVIVIQCWQNDYEMENAMKLLEIFSKFKTDPLGKPEKNDFTPKAEEPPAAKLNSSIGAEKDVDETPEFFIPEYGLDIEKYLEKEDIQGIHHLGRYHWAKKVLKLYSPKTVLDIACGAGYGSYILAGYLDDAMVTGGDYDARGIDIAKQTYSQKNLFYTQANIVKWESTRSHKTEPLGQYDAIVSFDTIEHLLHREISLIRMTQNLASNGVLLLSTPCGHENSLLNPGWEHHKIEYSATDLQNLLKRFFKTVLLPENSGYPNIEYWDNVINKGKQRSLCITNPVVCKDPIVF